jgi:general stress protein YciG
LANRPRAPGRTTGRPRNQSSWPGEYYPKLNLKSHGTAVRLIEFKQRDSIQGRAMRKDISTSNRGFASMDADKQREIARKGGRSVPNDKRSFSQNHELACEAGRKGGLASRVSRRQGQGTGHGGDTQ